MERDKNRTEFKKIAEFCRLEGKTVLEIGCGDGRFTGFLAAKAHRVFAIDPDEVRIRAARQSVRNADIRIGSGENLQFENESFDAVIFTFSLHHQDSRAALTEAYRVLRPGGLVVILEPTPDGEVEQFFRLFNDETSVLNQALQAIQNSRFRPEKEEIFCTDWKFDNVQEIYNFDWGHSFPGSDPEILEKMNALLGEKRFTSPICLKDKIRIFSLIKDEAS